MQWERVDRMPAVVALNVMASPLKSMPLIPLGLDGGNTGAKKSKNLLLGFLKQITFMFKM